jgi:peptide deformylase
MSILKVSRMGHPVLRKKIKPLHQSEIVTPPIQRLIDDMIQTMMEYQGAGLAAPQVHEELRLFVGLITTDEDDTQEDSKEPVEPEFLTIINPEVTQIGRVTEEDWEGCLSLPDLRGRVPRARDIRLRGFDRTGQRVDLSASGFVARMIQHETDHLDGILFIDRMESLESLSFIQEASRYHLGQD